MTELSHYPAYPLIGERFEDLDSRSEGRVIHVIGFATKNGYEVPGAYRVEVIAAPLAPTTVGHKYNLKAHGLEDEKRYRKVSH